MFLFLNLVCSSKEILTLGTSDVFGVRVSRKSSLNEGLACGCLNHVFIAEFLVPSLWVVLMYAQKEEGREVLG